MLVPTAPTDKDCIQIELFEEENVVFEFCETVVWDGVMCRGQLVYNASYDELGT